MQPMQSLLGWAGSTPTVVFASAPEPAGPLTGAAAGEQPDMQGIDINVSEPSRLPLSMPYAANLPGLRREIVFV